MTRTTIFVAIATYGPDASIAPMTGVGITPELASAALNQNLRDAYSGAREEEIEECIAEWIEEPIAQRHEVQL